MAALKSNYLIQNEYKLFSSPSDYAEKVVGKIREFNGLTDEVNHMLMFTTNKCIMQSITSG